MTDKTLIAKQLNRFLTSQLQTASLTDEEALEVPDLYPEWSAGKNYMSGQIVKYGTDSEGKPQLYRIQQDHTSQADWLPDATSALYKAIGFTPSGVPIWVQPQGAHDAYMAGAEVSHNGKIWISDVDNNVWEPGIHGWTEKNN